MDERVNGQSFVCRERSPLHAIYIYICHPSLGLNAHQAAQKDTPFLSRLGTGVRETSDRRWDSSIWTRILICRARTLLAGIKGLAVPRWVGAKWLYY